MAGPAPLKRAITPSLNPTGLGSSAAAIYALVQAVWNATHHHAAIDPQVVLAALTAAAFFYSRFKVTPVADPKDGNGAPLVALPLLPLVTMSAGGTNAGTPLQPPGSPGVPPG
jgi:hypothetical protein